MKLERPEKVLIAHSSLAEYEFDGDDLDRYYLPARGMADAPAEIKRGRLPFVIVPRKREIRELAFFYQYTLLNGAGIELVETKDRQYLMDKDIADDPDILEELLSISREGRLELYPYGVTDEFLLWASPLVNGGVRMVGDKKEYFDPMWWGHKGGLHRWIENLERPSFAEIAGLHVAEGYIARDKDQIVHACKLLGSYRVMLKPYILSGGFEMKRCENLDDVLSYVLPKMPKNISLSEEEMPIAVECLLDIDEDSFGELAYSSQFIGPKVIGKLTRQIVHGGKHWAGNYVPSGATSQFERKAAYGVRKFLSFARPEGPGGVDIASVDGEPVILEINGGRPTGAHNPKQFKEAFSPCSPVAIFEKEDRAELISLDVNAAWERLRAKEFKGVELSFSAYTGLGVYPLVWLQGMWSMLISFGETLEQVTGQLEEAKSILWT